MKRSQESQRAHQLVCLLLWGPSDEVTRLIWDQQVYQNLHHLQVKVRR